jgi:micrococcal nuclease
LHLLTRHAGISFSPRSNRPEEPFREMTAARVHGAMSFMKRTRFVLTIVALLSTSFSFAGEQLSGKCVAIHDGDTLSILLDGKPVKIRLWGIDAPELKQAFGFRAKQALSELAFGKPVRIEVIDRDRYGRIVGRVFINNTNINLVMVERGLAWWYRYHASGAKDLETAEKNARSARLGLWSDPHPQNPREWRKQNPR